MSVMDWGLDFAERGLIPSPLVRYGIRRLCRRGLQQRDAGNCEANQHALRRFLVLLKSSPVALSVEKANEQHYEVPPEFFELVLGQHRKYSCCLWNEGVTTLEAAEAAALQVTCERANIQNGMDILELGCGWGSLTLWMAAKYPASRITAVSNSHLQRETITRLARERGLENVTVITSDMNQFQATGHFDRIVSIEMFEHMRNYEVLLARIAGWLKPAGLLFVHIFTHRERAYPFETDNNDWMAKHFFTGGIMPSHDLLLHFQRDLHIVDCWKWSGTHYQKTSDAWLANLDHQRHQVMPILVQTYGEQQAARWFHRWRLFFLACAEMFGYAHGEEWGVSHYLFQNRLEGAPQ